MNIFIMLHMYLYKNSYPYNDKEKIILSNYFISSFNQIRFYNIPVIVSNFYP